MKEVLQTLYTELKYLKSQGQDSVFVDETSMQILNKLIAKNASHSVKENDFVKELTFVEKIDINKFEEKLKEKEIKVKRVESFYKKPVPSPQKFEIKGKSKEEKWESLRDIILADKVCNEHLHEGAKLVYGVGNLNADIFFCGEAPGADEEEQGEPFVGKAGQKLNDVIKAMGLKREEVYLSNIMSWRPEMEGSGNRAPTKEEMAYCLPYLNAQIDIIQPKIIVALGATATTGLLGADPKRKLLDIRGTWQNYMQSELIVTYHPSYLMQYATKVTKRLAWEDMLSVMEKLNLPISEKQRGYFL
ncbi:MAG: uracil-DNA glycosylase [Opitutales bacterium]